MLAKIYSDEYNKKITKNEKRCIKMQARAYKTGSYSGVDLHVQTGKIRKIKFSYKIYL